MLITAAVNDDSFMRNVKVSEARKRKNRRLKQAKEEAQQEIEKYKAEREKTFR